MAVKIDLRKKTVALSVGDLVAEPLVNVGRVAGLSVWTRMELGREAHINHQRAQGKALNSYTREIFVKHITAVDDFKVTIQGRIDGVIAPAYEGEPWVIEEIKSVVQSAMMFAALHANSYPHYTEQLRLYCFLTGKAGPARPAGIAGRLVFINVADGLRKEIEIAGPFDDCEKLISDRVRAIIEHATAEQRQHEERRKLAAGLRFPHDKPRQHQDDLIAGIERALAAGRHLLVSAPSGIGKTAGALYPTLRYALANDMRVFFVTAKNTQQQIARETLRKMDGPTAVIFRAREQMCINQVYACREEFCPHLQMIAPKLQRSGVVDRLLQQRLITPEAMMDAGRLASLCPFELALLEAERTDVVVCDYNYVFDPQVYFRRFFQDEDYSNTILIIDEAHNLVQRAMEYYSPRLRRNQISDLMANLHHVESSLARGIAKFLRRIEDFFELRARQTERGDEYSQLVHEDEEVYGGGIIQQALRQQSQSDDKFLIESPRKFFDELKPALNKLAVRYLLDKVERGRAIPDDPVEQFFAYLGQFNSALAMEGDEFAYIFDSTDGQSLKILCFDPSRQLAKRLEGFHSVIAMSATLSPMEFYRQMLGFDPERTDAVEFPSPFPPGNRKIAVVPSVSTTYQRRSGSYAKIAEIIITTAAAHRGHYMALFPSYEFLRAVAADLPAGDWELRVQEPKMNETQRLELVESLRQIEPPQLVLAVQGGLFAEGVDFPGDMLSGVIVVSPALPQVSFERELMQRYYEQKHGKGFEFAYLYPGMNRVIQSVGRLIRTETDRGVAVLVCQRFAQTIYSALFPPDWSDSGGKGLVTKNLATDLRKFWAKWAQ